MLKFIKNCIEEYKQCKADRAEDILLVENAIAQRDAETAKEDELNEKLLNESISFNENNGVYHFEITKYYNDSPRVFSCDEDTREACASTAKWLMLQARIYEASGC